jgi:hypothetical protein
VDVSMIGASGRLYIAGSSGGARDAAEAIAATLGRIEGRHQ